VLFTNLKQVNRHIILTVEQRVVLASRVDEIEVRESSVTVQMARPTRERVKEVALDWHSWKAKRCFGRA
jgi:hypothetical protein